MLTNQQIQSLFTFCEKHFVKYYDVQVELVDHLANAVEATMSADSKLTFENALDAVHKSFGIMGFAPLVAEKQQQAEKQSRKLYFKLLKEQFGWPKALAFLVLLFVLFTLLSFTPSFLNIALAAIVLICWPVFLVGMFRLQRKVAVTGKKFLVINLSWAGSLLFLPVYFINISNVFRVFGGLDMFHYAQYSWKIFIVSVFLSLYIIAIIVLWQMIISLKRNLIKTYPEVFSHTNINA